MARRRQRSRRITLADKALEPKWAGWEDMTGQQYHRFKETSQQWYYQTFKPDELIKHTYEWMKNNGYSKEDIKCAKAVPSYVIGTTTHITCRMLTNGMPDFNKKEDEYWQSLPGTMGKIRPSTEWVKIGIAKGIEKGKTLVKEKAKEEADDWLFKAKSSGRPLKDIVIRLIHMRRYSLHGKANLDDGYLNEVIQAMRDRK